MPMCQKVSKASTLYYFTFYLQNCFTFSIQTLMKGCGLPFDSYLSGGPLWGLESSTTAWPSGSSSFVLCPIPPPRGTFNCSSHLVSPIVQCPTVAPPADIRTWYSPLLKINIFCQGPGYFSGNVYEDRKPINMWTILILLKGVVILP